MKMGNIFSIALLLTSVTAIKADPASLLAMAGGLPDITTSLDLSFTWIDIDMGKTYNCHNEGTKIIGSHGNIVNANCIQSGGTVGEEAQLDATKVAANLQNLGMINQPTTKIVQAPLPGEYRVYEFEAPNPTSDKLKGKNIQFAVVAKALTQKVAQKEGVIDAWVDGLNQILLLFYRRVPNLRSQNKWIQMQASVIPVPRYTNESFALTFEPDAHVIASFGDAYDDNNLIRAIYKLGAETIK